ncbi:MAG: hypothetical protein Q8L92_07510 [Rubrivivax sp.]|nr:hypothetical protein [Rubrivivax sp.]
MNQTLKSTAGVALVVGTGLASAQGGHMMNGEFWGTGWMGGYGGAWVPILLVVIVGLLLWIAVAKRK